MKHSTLSLVLGIFISFALFWIMQAMISNNQQPLKSDSMQVIDFIKFKPIEKELETKREPEPEEPPPPPPPPPQQQVEEKPLPDMPVPELEMLQPDVLSNSDVKLEVIKKKRKPKPKVERVKAIIKAPPVVSKVAAVKPVKVIAKKPVKVVAPAKPKMSNKVNANVRATYKVAPKYPKKASRRRQQGWVKVQFIITASGRVKSPFVVSSKPSGVFNKAALKAIRRWKFKAKIINGQAVAQKAVQTIKFKLR